MLAGDVQLAMQRCHGTIRCTSRAKLHTLQPDTGDHVIFFVLHWQLTEANSYTHDKLQAHQVDHGELTDLSACDSSTVAASQMQLNNQAIPKLYTSTSEHCTQPTATATLLSHTDL